MRQISRDPFARETLERYAVRPKQGHGDDCAWCGNLNARGKLYIYVTVPDAGRAHADDKAFCSIDCRRAYYGL